MEDFLRFACLVLGKSSKKNIPPNGGGKNGDEYHGRIRKKITQKTNPRKLIRGKGDRFSGEGGNE